jgi:hypothetical protein
LLVLAHLAILFLLDFSFTLTIVCFIIVCSLYREEILSKLLVSESLYDKPWLAAIARKQAKAADLLARTEEEQQKSGYFHTLHEILQQPATWRETAKELASMSDGLLQTLAGARTLVLTGSGSSEYAGECVRLPLQNKLMIPAQTIGGGMLLTHGGKDRGTARRVSKPFRWYLKPNPTSGTWS